MQCLPSAELCGLMLSHHSLDLHIPVSGDVGCFMQCFESSTPKEKMGKVCLTRSTDRNTQIPVLIFKTFISLFGILHSFQLLEFITLKYSRVNFLPLDQFSQNLTVDQFVVSQRCIADVGSVLYFLGIVYTADCTGELRKVGIYLGKSL
jgi:hypothetical protein